MSASEDPSGKFLEEPTEACDAIAKLIQEFAERLADLATAFDHFGAVESYAEGSPARLAAELAVAITVAPHSLAN